MNAAVIRIKSIHVFNQKIIKVLIVLYVIDKQIVVRSPVVSITVLPYEN